MRQCERLRFISWREIIDKAPCRGADNPFRMRVSLPTGSSSPGELAVIPDGLFGLEYRRGGERSYRFFALEADRNTMPVRRSTLRQSSYLRKLLAYREVLAQSIHKTRLGVPNLLILNVTVNETHRQNIMEVLAELSGGKGSGLFLFKTIGALGDFMRAPEPSPAILLEPWDRAGNPPFKMGEE
ncbi:MAG: hypothetical protein HC869_20900 [Rhodospirillales bacterium]|nr:hypothetical protein [Rhodospirillales bacterium]